MSSKILYGILIVIIAIFFVVYISGNEVGPSYLFPIIMAIIIFIAILGKGKEKSIDSEISMDDFEEIVEIDTLMLYKDPNLLQVNPHKNPELSMWWNKLALEQKANYIKLYYNTLDEIDRWWEAIPFREKIELAELFRQGVNVNLSQPQIENIYFTMKDDKKYRKYQGDIDATHWWRCNSYPLQIHMLEYARKQETSNSN